MNHSDNDNDNDGDAADARAVDGPNEIRDGGLPVTRLSRVTRDESEAAALIEQLYSGLGLRVTAQENATELAVRATSVDHVRAERLRHATRFTSTLGPSSVLSAGVVLNGRVGLDDGRQVLRLERGDVLLLRTDTPVTSELIDMDVAMLTIPLAAVASLAESGTGIDAGDLRFTGGAALTPELGRYFADVVTFVHRQLLGVTADTMSPLIAEQLLHLTASAVLATFPHTATERGHASGVGRAGPPLLRRAMAYIEERADQALTVGDVARAVGTGPRALQAAFARQETTPMAYWRRVRLERAHDDLRRADPTTGVTVAQVAARWGFGHPGRFARTYAATYGRSPSATLHHEIG